MSSQAGIAADVLSRRIDQFLGARGYASGTAPPDAERTTAPEPDLAAARSNAPPLASPVLPPAGSQSPKEAPLTFVCEEDVRLAIRDGRTLLIAERAIVTPAARDLADEHQVLSVAPWQA